MNVVYENIIFLLRIKNNCVKDIQFFTEIRKDLYSVVRRINFKYK